MQNQYYLLLKEQRDFGYWVDAKQLTCCVHHTGCSHLASLAMLESRIKDAERKMVALDLDLVLGDSFIALLDEFRRIKSDISRIRI